METQQGGSLEEIAEKKVVSLYVSEFNETTGRDFLAGVLNAESSGQSVLPVYINSYGGEIDIMAGMIDVMRSCTIPVATIVIGKAMSAGVLLAAAGTKGLRFASPNSRFMIHNVQGGTCGDTPEMDSDIREMLKMQKRMFTQMDKFAGQERGYFMEALRKKQSGNWWLTPVQAKKHGLIDHIKIPRMQTTCLVLSDLV
jgi:ATP-dependent Clp protease protease subunit